MLIRIDHTTTYTHQYPPRSIIQILRLTPRSLESQHIRRWEIEVDCDARMRRGEDAYGNLTHTLYVDQPSERLTIRVKGEVETSDTAGTVRGHSERLSPLVYLRPTGLTEPDAAITTLAKSITSDNSLERLHSLMQTLYRDLRFEIGTTTTTHTAAEVLQQKSGVCQDYAHLFIAVARCMGIPARYVSGHLYRSDGQALQGAAHAWAEAWVEHLGWVGFDPANGLCPTEAYVRIASGLDYLDAAPIRGSSYGGGFEDLQVEVEVQDTRTNAGVDNITSYRKLHVTKVAGERVIALATAGNLSVTQTALSMVREGIRLPDSDALETLETVPSLFRAAKLVGHGIRQVRREISPSLEAENLVTDASVLLGGQVGSGPVGIYLIYSQGNFIECQPDTPYMQIGEFKYGKPILDRALHRDTTLAEAVKLGLISFDSTLRSNISVGLPLDMIVIRKDGLDGDVRRLEVDDPYFRDLGSRWSQALADAHRAMPLPPWLSQS